MPGDGDRYGEKSGLTRGQFLVALLDNQFNAKLSDEKICRVMEEEFPKSDVNYRKYIRMYRNRYNRGEWSCQRRPPLVPVPRFNDKGEVITATPGPTPRYPWEEKEDRT